MVWDVHIQANSYILVSLLSIALVMVLDTVRMGLAARNWHLVCMLGMPQFEWMRTLGFVRDLISLWSQLHGERASLNQILTLAWQMIILNSFPANILLKLFHQILLSKYIMRIGILQLLVYSIRQDSGTILLYTRFLVCLLLWVVYLGLFCCWCALRRLLCLILFCITGGE